MFEEVDNSIRFLEGPWRYFLQLFFCYIFVTPAGALLSFVLPLLGLSGDHPPHIHFAGYDALFCLLVGAFFGWAMWRLLPSAVTTGQWIWVLPAAFLLSAVLSVELPPAPWLPEFAFDTGGIGGLGVDIFTFPAFSAAGYSIAMALVALPRQWGRFKRVRTSRLAFEVVLACAALFTLAALLLHRFELAQIDKWSRVRVVAGRVGVRLSADAGLLCRGAKSTGALLTSYTYVQIQESRSCGGDQVIGAVVPAEPQPSTVERVKVLLGPQAGLEGWVFSNGLDKPHP